MGMNKIRNLKSKLTANLGGIKLKNPVLVAAGTFGYGDEYAEIVDLNKLGAVVTKTITLKPQAGNPPPRIFETVSGLLNSIGLENVGLKVFIKDKLPFFKKFSVPVIVSIAANSAREFVIIVEELEKIKNIAGLELNLSCPNITSKQTFYIKPVKLGRIVKQVRRHTRLPLIAKLGPYPDPISTAVAVESSGADGLTLANTFPGMAISVPTRLPELGAVFGGLSGPCIKPLGIRLVYEVKKMVKIPIVASGGIMTTEDALEYIIAGATAVSIGTANFVDPQTPLKIISGLEKYLKVHRISSIKKLIGGIKVAG